MDYESHRINATAQTFLIFSKLLIYQTRGTPCLGVELERTAFPKTQNDRLSFPWHVIRMNHFVSRITNWHVNDNI